MNVDDKGAAQQDRQVEDKIFDPSQIVRGVVVAMAKIPAHTKKAALSVRHSHAERIREVHPIPTPEADTELGSPLFLNLTSRNTFWLAVGSSQLTLILAAVKTWYVVTFVRPGFCVLDSYFPFPFPLF